MLTALVLALLIEPPLPNEFVRIAEVARGRVGVAVAVLEEDGEPVTLRGSEPFPMQSVYKLPIAMAVLRQVDRGKLALGTSVKVEKADLVPPGLHSPLRDKNPEGATVSVRELIRLAIAESDGTASDVLMKLVGGPEVVMAYLKEVGVADVLVRDTEASLGGQHDLQYRNSATPLGALRLLRALHEGPALTAKSRALLRQDLVESTPGPQRLKGLLPPGTQVAHKTGSSGTENGVAAATNDIGIVRLPDGRHLAIAVFVSDARAGLPAREAVIAQIARAAWRHYVPGTVPH